MLRIFRGRWAAAGVFFACPGVVLACRGRTFQPPLYWQASDFEWPRRQAAPSEPPFLSLDATFVSTLIRGQFATLAPAADWESEPEEGATGFRRTLESFWPSDSVPSHLDGAPIDVTGMASDMEECNEAILDFERAVAEHAHWLTPVEIDEAQRPVANDLPATDGPELRFPLTGEVWEFAKPSEDMDRALLRMNDAEVASRRGVMIVNPSPRDVVFTGPASATDSKAPIEFDALERTRSTETVERLWPERPVLLTLVVTYRPTGCRSLAPFGPSLVHRFPLALVTSEP